MLTAPLSAGRRAETIRSRATEAVNPDVKAFTPFQVAVLGEMPSIEQLCPLHAFFLHFQLESTDKEDPNRKKNTLNSNSNSKLPHVAFPKAFPLPTPTHPSRLSTPSPATLPPTTTSQTLPVLRSPLGALFLGGMEPDMVDRVHSIDDAGDHRQSCSLSLGRRGAKSRECQHRTTCAEENVGGAHLVEEKAVAVFRVEVRTGSRLLVKLRSTVSRWRELNLVRTVPGISQPRVLCRPGWDCPPPRLCRGLLLSAASADSDEVVSQASPATAFSNRPSASCPRPSSSSAATALLVDLQRPVLDPALRMLF